jgi:hypothetical protein
MCLIFIYNVYSKHTSPWFIFSELGVDYADDELRNLSSSSYKFFLFLSDLSQNWNVTTNIS